MNTLYKLSDNRTICALSTAPGISAIALIRISGEDSINICHKNFISASKEKNLKDLKQNTIVFGKFFDEDELIDEVLISKFIAPHSYTGEDMIEISCHGSIYIQQKIINLLIKNGAVYASPGEFTLRAFLNGKFNLSQAEAVADLIASNSKSSHDLAISQMRGGYFKTISDLRTKLVDLASLLELELDFSEEDVEFANRDSLKILLNKIKNEVTALIESFKFGNVLKNGIPVAIIGNPNVGKSTLLNAILNEEKAIVSEIPGTTRDAIEDVISINGISFRFIDTAGIREAENDIENIGITRTYQKANQAFIILYVVDISKSSIDEILESVNALKNQIDTSDKRIFIIANKTDMIEESPKNFKNLIGQDIIFISAKRKENINLVANVLFESVSFDKVKDNSLVSNIRHKEAFENVLSAVFNIEAALENNLSTDLIAIDIKPALYNLGLITGEVTNDEILGNIFGKFCIGK